jgi:hypothetical protein
LFSTSVFYILCKFFQKAENFNDGIAFVIILYWNAVLSFIYLFNSVVADALLSLCHGLYDRGTGVQFLLGANDIYLLHSVQTTSVAQPPIQ